MPCRHPSLPWPWTCAIVLVLCLLALPAGARPQALALSEADPVAPGWPALTLLSDPDHRLTLDQVRARQAEFQAPASPENNLGPRRDTVWLHLPLALREGDGHWLLDIDYPPLQQAELYHLRDGQLVARHRLGSDQPYADRPLPSRSHVAPLQLVPGAHEEVYLRLRTSTAMVVPIHLMRPEAYMAREQAMQLVQGLVAGIALALLAYSLVQGFSLRSSLFGLYAGAVGSSAMFTFTYVGLTQQYLWHMPTPLLAKAAPMAVLLGVASAGVFVARSMELRVHDPRLNRPLLWVSALALACFSLAGLGLVDYRQTQVGASLLGMLLMLLAVPAGWRTGRRGNPMGWYMLMGWGAYLVGVLALSGLLRGWVPANPVTQHLCQIGWVLEMLAWLRVLSLHVESVRQAAERSELARRTMESLAHTDALTGLPNRRGLQAAIGPALAAATPTQALALLLLDLDGFKPVNDRLGHEAGDEVLVQVGQRLKQALRTQDVVARIGGDEFVIVATGLSSDHDAQLLGSKVLRAFDAPFIVGGGEPCRVGLTIGYALAPQDGQDAAELLKRADAAMYAGKQAGRHCIRRGGRSTAAAGAMA